MWLRKEKVRLIPHLWGGIRVATEASRQHSTCHMRAVVLGGFRDGSQISSNPGKNTEHIHTIPFSLLSLDARKTLLRDFKKRTDKDVQVQGTLLLTPHLQLQARGITVQLTLRARGELLCQPVLESSRCPRDAH